MESTSVTSVLGGGQVRPGEQEFVSPSTAALLLTRTTRTIARLAKAGELTPHYPDGGRYMFFRRSEIEAYLERRRSQASARL